MNTQAAKAQAYLTPQTSRIIVSEAGEKLTLDYAGLEAFHQGDSWWGCTVAFRALQQVSEVLNHSSILARDNLIVVSGHPGPGVRDAIEYVTRCVGKKRFSLLNKVSDQISCSRDMVFEWWISNGWHTVYIKLKNDFVPAEFYTLLDRLGTDNEAAKDKLLFDAFKKELSQQLWQMSLDDAFETTRFEQPLSIGEVPDA